MRPHVERGLARIARKIAHIDAETDESEFERHKRLREEVVTKDGLYRTLRAGAFVFVSQKQDNGPRIGTVGIVLWTGRLGIADVADVLAADGQLWGELYRSYLQHAVGLCAQTRKDLLVLWDAYLRLSEQNSRVEREPEPRKSVRGQTRKKQNTRDVTTWR